MAYSLTDFVKNLKEKGLVYALKEDFQNSKLLKAIMPFLLATSLYALPPEKTEYYPNGQIKKRFYYAGEEKNTCVTEVYDQRGNMVEYVWDVWCNGPSQSDFCKKCNYVYNDSQKEIRIRTECTEDKGCDGKEERKFSHMEVKKEIRKSRELLERQKKMAEQLQKNIFWYEGFMLIDWGDHDYGQELGVEPCDSSKELCPDMDVSEFKCEGDICSKIEVVEIRDSQEDNSKYWKKRIFDNRGNLVRFEEYNSWYEYYYDNQDRLKSSVRNSFYWYEYHYDNQGRPESFISPGYCEKYWWDKNDNLTGYVRDIGCDGIKGDTLYEEWKEDYPELCDKNDVWSPYSYRCTLEFKEEYKRIHDVPLPNYDLKIIQHTNDLGKNQRYEISVYKCPKNINCTLNNLNECEKICESMPGKFIDELLREIKLPEYKPPLIQKQHKQNIKQQSKAKGKATKKGKKSGKRRRK
jgi:hypothetical protein